MKIFRYLRGSLATVGLIILLCCAQAFCDLSLPYYTSRIVDIGIAQGGIPDAATRAEYVARGADLGAVQLHYMLGMGARMLGLTLLSITAAIFVCLLASRVAAKIGFELRGSVFAKVLTFSSEELDRFSTASLITRNTNDVQQIQTVAVIFLRMVLYAPIIGAGGIVMIATTHAGMGWVIAVAVAAVLALVGSLMRVALPKFQKIQALLDRLNLISREMLTGIFVVRAFSRERYEERRFDAASRELMATQLFTARALAFIFPALLLIMNATVVAIVWFGAKDINLGALHVGNLMAFITYTMQIVIAFMMLSLIFVFFPRANVAATRIEEVLAITPAIADKPAVVCEDRPLAAWRGEVRFNDVSFRFPGAETNVLEHISFTARPGETTAIVGSTGSGKSTIVRLLPRFYDVTQGSITIDGVDIRDLSRKKLRSLMGFVPQRGVLFSGDIESNLKFGATEMSDETMREAAQIAQAAGFIAEKEGAYKSPVSQGGGNVSGGQRQRLSIARAIARNPRIVIFDDSFSALDYKTDLALRRALRDKLKDSAVIIVAQRISTIMRAQQIIVLDEGRVVGIGTHEDLMRDCEVYREIATSQLDLRTSGENAATKGGAAS